MARQHFDGWGDGLTGVRGVWLDKERENWGSIAPGPAAPAPATHGYALQAGSGAIAPTDQQQDEHSRHAGVSDSHIAPYPYNPLPFRRVTRRESPPPKAVRFVVRWGPCQHRL